MRGWQEPETETPASGGHWQSGGEASSLRRQGCLTEGGAPSAGRFLQFFNIKITHFYTYVG